jgi:hypothetical protein
MSKGIIKAIIVGVVALGVGGCAAGGVAGLDQPAEVTFDQVIDEHFGEGVTSEAQDVAEAFCLMLDTGIEYNEAVLLTLKVAEGTAISPYDIGVILGAGVPTFCPEYSTVQNIWIVEHQ